MPLASLSDHQRPARSATNPPSLSEHSKVMPSLSEKTVAQRP
ncbi:hypothetical protein A2U01_0104468, partial [Trifolium medium]|nr:hypothetical protein [Trifolium medium]